MRENEKLVTIERFENSFDAELAKLMLDNAGIESVVLGEALGHIYPDTGTSFCVVLQVFESDVDKAKAVLTQKKELGEDEDVDA